MSSSPQLSLSGCSSLFSLSSSSSGRDNDSAAAAPAMPPLPPRRPLLSLSVGGDEEADEDGEEYLLGGLDLQLMGGGGGSSGDGNDERKTIRMMKNRESALRSRARKRAYVQELEKEVRRLVNENLKLKRQCKQSSKPINNQPHGWAQSGDGCTDPAKRQQQQERSHQENLLIRSALAA